MQLYRFHELDKNIQANVIYGKIFDTFKACLLSELATAIVNGENPLLEQCQNELYDIDGNFIKEVK